MILTILKQTTRFHLDEKDYEVANVYADLYSKMILQYVNKRPQAIAALKDLAYEFYIHGLSRSAAKYYDLVQNNYGITAMNDEDLSHFGDVMKKLNHFNEAINCYKRLVRYFPHSTRIKKTYKNLSSIYETCHNDLKAQRYKNLLKLENIPPHSSSRKQERKSA